MATTPEFYHIRLTFGTWPGAMGVMGLGGQSFDPAQFGLGQPPTGRDGL